MPTSRIGRSTSGSIVEYARNQKPTVSRTCAHRRALSHWMGVLGSGSGTSLYHYSRLLGNDGIHLQVIKSSHAVIPKIARRLSGIQSLHIRFRPPRPEPTGRVLLNDNLPTTALPGQTGRTETMSVMAWRRVIVTRLVMLAMITRWRLIIVPRRLVVPVRCITALITLGIVSRTHSGTETGADNRPVTAADLGPEETAQRSTECAANG